MTTATFSKAVHVYRSETGCYEFAGREKFFDDAISFEGENFEWEIFGSLLGWGKWTHVVCVTYGDRIAYYFVR
jgi:hypothetical protein